MKQSLIVLAALAIGVLLGHAIRSDRTIYQSGFQACQEQFEAKAQITGRWIVKVTSKANFWTNEHVFQTENEAQTFADKLDSHKWTVQVSPEEK